MIKKYIIPAMITLVFASCNKQEKIMQGTWVVTESTYDGKDELRNETSWGFICKDGTNKPYTTESITNEEWIIDDQGSLTIHEQVISTDIVDWEKSIADCIAHKTEFIFKYDYKGSWDIRKEKLHIDIIEPKSSTDSWEIVELRDKKMKLKDGKISITLVKK